MIGMVKYSGKSLLVLFVFFWGGLWASGPNLWAQELKATEYQVKAAFIYNFLQFVDWPAKPGKAPGPALNLCIMGENPFGSAFESYQGETVRRWKLFIRQAQTVHELKDCQVLFICPSEKGRAAQIARQAAGQGILTIGDSDGLAHQGVMINFHLDRGKVRFEINIEAARRAGITISSHLLKLAKIIQEPS